QCPTKASKAPKKPPPDTAWRRMMMTLLYSSILVLCLTGVSLGAKLQVGNCPRVDAMQDWDARQWPQKGYMLLAVTQKGIMMRYIKKSNYDISLILPKIFKLINQLSIGHVFNYEGKLTMVNPTNPAKMSLWWPGHLSNDITFTVVDTDYSQYALTFECQKMWIMSRTTGAILSRKPTLDAAIINKLKDQLEAFDINRTEFSPMQQTECIKPEDADLQINFDGESLGLLPDEIAIDNGLLPDDIATDNELREDHVPQELLDAYNRETENNEIFP
ncbi:unnamed protein product, partial [Meganyctiphanes norvegica]